MYCIKAPKNDTFYWVPILTNLDVVEHLLSIPFSTMASSTKTSSMLSSLSLSLSPSLHLPENILHCSNGSGNDIVDFVMQAPSIFHHWSSFHLFILRQATSTCIHKRNTSWLLSICTAIFRLSSATTSLFVLTTPQPLPSKTPTLKLYFRIRPCFWPRSSQILYPTSSNPRSTPLSHHSGSSMRPLAYPTTSTPSHVNLSPYPDKIEVPES